MIKKILLILFFVLATVFTAYAIEHNYQVRISTDSSGNPEYIGEAIPSVGEASPYWRIMKLSWTGVYCTKVSWAEGSDAMELKWSLKSTYTYP